MCTARSIKCSWMKRDKKCWISQVRWGTIALLCPLNTGEAIDVKIHYLFISCVLAFRKLKCIIKILSVFLAKFYQISVYFWIIKDIELKKIYIKRKLAVRIYLKANVKKIFLAENSHCLIEGTRIELLITTVGWHFSVCQESKYRLRHAEDTVAHIEDLTKVSHTNDSFFAKSTVITNTIRECLMWMPS